MISNELKEMIKTEDPNIVIERTFTEIRISITGLQSNISEVENSISNINKKILSINQSLKLVNQEVKEILLIKAEELASNKISYESLRMELEDKLKLITEL